MIELKNISKSYDKKTKFIEELNLTINDGEIFGFIGANGAGKTTTIKMITGILKPDGGDIFIDGKSITKNDIEAKKNMGYVSDNPDMFLKLKGIEYLNFMADMYKVSKKDRKEQIEFLADKFEMSDSLNNKIMSYSHGMRQKIMIMGALLSKPKNWILDEPLTGLDPKSAYSLKEYMKEYVKNGNSVFFSTHVLEVAEKLCDRIGIINKGKIIFVGTLDELRNNFDNKDMSLEELFLDLIKD